MCFDCRAAGFHKRTDRAFSGQHTDHRDDIHGDGIVLTPKEERQRRPSRPPGFVDSKSILKDLKKPVNARRAAPKRKLVQEDVALYDAIAQRDMTTRERKTRMDSANIESSSLSGYSQAPIKPNSRLIRLGIRTAFNGPPIWVKVSRSAPLEKMFMAALQSGDAPRGYVFMLPGRYVHLDGTTDEVRSIRDFKRNTANCISSSVLQIMIALRCISFLSSGYQTSDLELTTRMHKTHLAILQKDLAKQSYPMLATQFNLGRCIILSLTRFANLRRSPMMSSCPSRSILTLSPQDLMCHLHHQTAPQRAS